MQRSVWIGWEPREAAAFAVARHSLARRASTSIPVHGLIQSQLRAEGIYRRPEHYRGQQRWDEISDAPMATEFACSRFLVPYLASRLSEPGDMPRWALFMDCDMLIRTDIHQLFEECDPAKAVMVVRHEHNPRETVKMDGQMQTVYSRKNWSSVCAFNLDHPLTGKLDPDLVNSLPGRDLHAFVWLRDEDIGGLDPRWNYLVGHTKGVKNPGIVHHTDGIPLMAGYENVEFADEWRRELEHWAAG